MHTPSSPAAPALHHKAALVTGGSRGVGRNVALALAAAGADVLVTYRTRKDDAEEVVAEIQRMDRRAAAIAADLGGTADIAGLVEAVDATLTDWGTAHLHALVNNAGVGSHQPFGAITEEDFDRVVDTNLKSVVFLTQALLPKLADGGRIVAIGSGLSRFSLPGFAIYGSLKGALERLMAYLARELGPRGITANAISPGALDTEFNAAALEHNPGMRDFIASVTAQGRMGVADDVGAVVAMLCSPAAQWVTGQRIEVSGGMFL